MRPAAICLSLLFLASGAAAGEGLTLEDAVATALTAQADVVVERESLAIAEASVARAESAYEPTLRGEARLRRRTDPVNSILSGAPAGEVAPTFRSLQTSAALVQLLPTGGSMTLFTSVGRDSTDSVLALLTPSWSSSAGIEIRQPLLQNRTTDPVRRSIRVARIDRTRAHASLRRVITEVTAAVEKAYWSLVQARADVEVRTSNLALAERLDGDTRIRVEAGTQPEADLAQTAAEIERRRSELVAAQEMVVRSENNLRLLLASDASDAIWSEPIVPLDAPSAAASGPDVVSRIAIALERRPEIEELRQRLGRLDVETEAAGDRLRPQVDLVAAYSGRGLAGSENEDAIAPFGLPAAVPDAVDGALFRSLGTLAEHRFPDASLGVAVSLPIGNSAAKQELAVVRATRRQAEAAIAQLRNRIAAEVGNAAAALTSASQRIAATRAAREAAEVQLQAELDRFEGGISNHFFVLTRQNDLAAARLAENAALLDSRKASSELARATGTLLEDRGIEVDR